MDVTEVAKEIARISPAAGREADKLIAEITRLQETIAGQAGTIAALRETEADYIRMQASGPWLDGANQVRRATAETLWHLFEGELPEFDNHRDLWEMGMSRVRQLLPENRRRSNEELRQLELAAQERGEAARARDVHVALRRDSNEKPNEGYPSLKDWWHSLLREVHELHNLNLERVDRRTMQAHILTTLRRSLWTEQAYEDVTPTTDEEFWDEFHQLNKKLTGGKTEARQKFNKELDAVVDRHRERMEKRIRAIAEELSASLGGSRDRPESYPTDMEWLSGLFNAAKEIRAAQEEAPRDIEPPRDLAAMQIQAERISQALNTTHSALLEMQEGYLEERRGRLKAIRDLRRSVADVGYWKGAAKDAEDRLGVVDMALRGQATRIPTVSPYRSDTFDLAVETHQQMVNYRADAERELKWRQELEEMLTTPKAAQAVPHWKLATADPEKHVYIPKFAECGAEYPCKHAPDGGNHPVAASPTFFDNSDPDMPARYSWSEMRVPDDNPL